MKKINRIDWKGVFIEDILIKEGELIPLDCTEFPCPDGLYRARLIGTEWVEDMAQEEIDLLKNVVVEPTEIELLQEANSKLKQRLYDAEQVASDNSQSQQELLELLLEMGVI